MTESKWLLVARVVRPQGHRGELLAELLTDFPERLESGRALSLRAAGAEQPERVVHIAGSRLHGSRIVLRLEECSSMNEAEQLRGFELLVPWEERAALGEGEVYIDELVGCSLFDLRTASVVGEIIGVDRESTAGALLVVEREGRELLVPFVNAFELSWDLAARTVTMRLPEGLLELED